MQRRVSDRALKSTVIYPRTNKISYYTLIFRRWQNVPETVCTTTFKNECTEEKGGETVYTEDCTTEYEEKCEDYGTKPTYEGNNGNGNKRKPATSYSNFNFGSSAQGLVKSMQSFTDTFSSAFSGSGFGGTVRRWFQGDAGSGGGGNAGHGGEGGYAIDSSDQFHGTKNCKKVPKKNCKKVKLLASDDMAKLHLIFPSLISRFPRKSRKSARKFRTNIASRSTRKSASKSAAKCLARDASR